jgi:hypothetical protein
MTCAYGGIPLRGVGLRLARGGRPRPKVVPFRPPRRTRDRTAPPRRPAPGDYVRWIWAALLIVALLLPYLWHN